MRIVTSHVFRKEILPQIASRGKLDSSRILQAVNKIIMDVKEKGDEALLLYTEKFDKTHLSASRLRVTRQEIKESYSKLEPEQIKALEESALNIARFHKYQLRYEFSMEVSKGITVGRETRPLSSVGVYAPGGTASYPSSLLMCAIPAKVAGVQRIVVCSSPKMGGDLNPALLAAADIAGVTEIYRVGGAQAIAALAYGTETVPKVDKIVGPGNIFVMTAKLQVSEDVAIDIPAGPSEILIIADEYANASFIASDLLAQAEHDSRALTILLTTSNDLALTVKREQDNQVRSLSRREIIKSLSQMDELIVVVKNIEEAVHFANIIAPEHLHIQTKAPRKVFEKIRNAGAVFLGEYSPVALGDYSAGLNHVLPTGGYARFHSGLSTRDFLKTINFLECTEQGCLNLEETTVTLAKLEGFDGHARSVSLRRSKIGN